MNHDVPIDDYSQPVTVTLRDTLTAETAVATGFNLWFWSEGNGSCDCNREGYFDNADGNTKEEMAEMEERVGYCIGSHRYLVVEVEPMPNGFTLSDFNGSYPKALREANGVP
jgi:hypothetical protein